MARALAMLLLGVASCAPGDPATAPGETSGRSEGHPGADATRPNVVLIVVDTLRRDRLGCYGAEGGPSPRIDELARGAVLYRRCTSQVPWTLPSIASMLTSQYSSTLGMLGETDGLPESVTTLAEHLRDHGYRTAAVVSHTLCSARFGFDQGFDRFDESNLLEPRAATSDGVSERALEILEGFGDAPYFLWLHYFDPHFPYLDREPSNAPESTARRIVTPETDFETLLRSRKRLRPDDVAEILRWYDSEIRATDRAIGRVLDRLRERGEFDDALIVLTADHGEEFLDHGSFSHTKTLYEELVGVPLVVKFPRGVARGGGGRSGDSRGGDARADDARSGGARSCDERVCHLDLVPTVLEVAGLPVPEGVEGRAISRDCGSPAGDAAEAAADSRPHFLETSNTRRLRAVVRGDHKLIRNLETGIEELYDLASDPAERTDLAAERPDLVSPLAAALDEWIRLQDARAAEAPTVPLSDEERAALDALGYGGE